MPCGVTDRRRPRNLALHPEGDVAQVPPALTRPRTASRARFTAAARSAKSAPTLSRPWTRARLPPWRRRMRWASLRSTFGPVARTSSRQAGSREAARPLARSASCRPIAIGRPVAELVQRLASGHLAQAERKRPGTRCRDQCVAASASGGLSGVSSSVARTASRRRRARRRAPLVPRHRSSRRWACYPSDSRRRGGGHRAARAPGPRPPQARPGSRSGPT
jgi:hypothetical protein